MTIKLLRSKKSEWLLWSFYFLSFLTISSFAIIFTGFILKALYQIIQYGAGAEWTSVFGATLKILGMTYLWVLPWAALLTLFYFRNERTWIGRYGKPFLKVYLKTPPLVLGIVILSIMIEFPHSVAMSAVIGSVILPRLIFGWIKVIKQTPLDLGEVGLSLGMTKIQLLKHVYLRREGWLLFRHFLGVTCLLLGTVAPVLYLASSTGWSGVSTGFLPLKTFMGVIKDPGGSSFTWSSLLFLLVLTALFVPKTNFQGKSL